MRILIASLFCLVLSSSKAQVVPDTLWSYKIKQYTMGSPVIDDGVYYTGNEKGFVVALDVNTGKEIWNIKMTGGLYHNALIDGDNLFLDFAKHGNAVVCLDKKTGKSKWWVDSKYQFDDDVPCKIVKNEDAIVFNSLDSTIVCLLQSNGKEKWKFKATGITSPVSAYKNSFVFSCADGNIYQIDKKTGKLEAKIKFSIANRNMFVPPVIFDDMCVISDTATTITAVSLSKKKVVWAKTSNSPFLFGFDKYAVSFTDDGMHAFDVLTGEEKWSVPGRHKWYMYPVIFEGKMYYQSRKEAKLYVIDNEGKIERMYKAFDKTYTSPAISKDKIILSIVSTIFAIENK